jgi:hypothetical protein
MYRVTYERDAALGAVRVRPLRHLRELVGIARQDQRPRRAARLRPPWPAIGCGDALPDHGIPASAPFHNTRTASASMPVGRTL